VTSELAETAHASEGHPPRRPPAQRAPAPLPTDILLVEDNPREVELILKPLQELDGAHRIEVVRDGEEALDYIFGRGAFRHEAGSPLPLPRLVLLGLKLPRVDGLDVLRAIRANARTCLVPVVVLTSAQDPRELAQCYQLGANSCVQKPVKYEEFWNAMQAIGRYWLAMNQAPPPPATPIA
jgi:two-component system response regulator